MAINLIILNTEQAKETQTEFNQFLSLVFKQPMQLVLTDEFDCAVIVRDNDRLCACGFGYIRSMSQGDVNFRAGILGGKAVHPEYHGQGLAKKVVNALGSQLEIQQVKYSFLFAYQPQIYTSAGYSELTAPIHFFDTPQNRWNQFVYRGGMVKSHTNACLSESEQIEFSGPVY